MKKAFTVAELLIVLMIIGVIAILMISSMLKSTPDKNKVLFKKAYSVCERTVGELVNDETLYPYDPDRIGFRNTDDVPNPSGDGSSVGGVNKLCVLFVGKLNTIGTPVTSGGTCSFETTDGILWHFPITDSAYPISIEVDVNGTTGPNGHTGSNNDQDQFTIKVQADGKVTVDGATEVEYLREQSMNKRNQDMKRI